MLLANSHSVGALCFGGLLLPLSFVSAEPEFWRLAKEGLGRVTDVGRDCPDDVEPEHGREDRADEARVDARDPSDGLLPTLGNLDRLYANKSGVLASVRGNTFGLLPIERRLSLPANAEEADAALCWGYACAARAPKFIRCGDCFPSSICSTEMERGCRDPALLENLSSPSLRPR